MSQILIAIDNNIIFNNLVRDKRFNFFNKDIIYKEGIVEVLEHNEDIDVVIINNNISGQEGFEKFILKLKNARENLKIILFLDFKDNQLINFLNINEIYSIYDIQEIGEKRILEILENELSTKNRINEEIDTLRKLIEKKKVIKEESIKEDAKIIVFTGESNVGKTTLSTICAKLVNKLNKKTLLISFNNWNNDIEILLNCEGIKNKTNRITEKLDLLVIDKNFKFIINQILKRYEFVIFDMNILRKNNYTKDILLKSNTIFFIIEADNLGIKKGSRMLEKIILNFNISLDKIEIVFNNFDKFSIRKKILKKVFYKFKIKGFCKRGKVHKFIKQKIVKKE